jgi:hypothetical protein
MYAIGAWQVKIWLVNESTLAPDLTPSLLMQIAGAAATQACEHFAAMWESSGVVVNVADYAASVPPDDSALIITDNPVNPNALGDHETVASGRPSGRIYLGPIFANGGNLIKGQWALSAVISHEVLEMVGDPYTNWWCDGADGLQYALEVCDPVEGDTYEVDGISVSNFVGPRYFSAGPGPYDYLGKLTKGFTMTSGGYLITRQPGGPVNLQFGARYPEWRKPLKQRHKLRAE